MATLFADGIDVPDAKLVKFAGHHSVVQGEYDPAETAGEALGRLEDVLLQIMGRSYIQFIRRELEAANVSAEGNVLTKL